MQYNIYINQIKACEWGLNLQQAALFSFLYEIPSWAECHVISGITWHRIARSKLAKELPILTSKTDTIYRQMRVLEDAGLIKVTQQGTVTLVRITSKGTGWNRDLGNFSEGSDGTPPATPEKNPTYHSTNLDPPTTPPTPQQPEPAVERNSSGSDEIERYLQLVVGPAAEDKADPVGYVGAARKRLKLYGLGKREKSQLAALTSGTARTQDAARTQRLLATEFDDSHIPPSPEALKLWATWESDLPLPPCTAGEKV